MPETNLNLFTEETPTQISTQTYIMGRVYKSDLSGDKEHLKILKP